MVGVNRRGSISSPTLRFTEVLDKSIRLSPRGYLPFGELSIFITTYLFKA